VHHALPVRVGERARHLAQHRRRLGRRQPPRLGEPVAQGAAVDERHRVVEQPAGLAGGQERHDVRVLQRGGELDLAPEAVGAHRRRELGRQHLDHHAAAEGDLGGEVDAAHPAAAELALDPVRGGEGAGEHGEVGGTGGRVAHRAPAGRRGRRSRSPPAGGPEGKVMRQSIRRVRRARHSADGTNDELGTAARPPVRRLAAPRSGAYVWPP
jgi:hypothetical protein